MKKYKNIKKLFFATIIGSLLFTLIPTTNIYATTHTHTSACYPQGATLHVHSDACYKDLSTHDCGGTITWTVVGTTKAKCPKCGNEITITYYSGVSSGCGAKFSSTYHERCTNCNYKITQVDGSEKVVYPQTACKYTVKNAGRGDLICGKENNTYYDAKGNKVELQCSNVVVSIAPLKTNQISNTPDFTLQATYLDGHVANIQPTETNYDATKTYNNTLITLKYTGQVNKIGNTGTLTANVYVTSGNGGSDNPYMDETGTTSATTTELKPANITITPLPTPQLQNPNYNSNYNGSTLGNTGYSSANRGSMLGIAGNRSSGGGYYGNNYNGYRNDSIQNGTNDSVKDSDIPELGTTNDMQDETLIVPQDEYIKRTPVDIVFKTQKDVTPTVNYGVLKFSENVRNEINDTVGTAPQQTTTNVPTTQNDDTQVVEIAPTTQPQQPNKKSASLTPLILLGVVIFASIGGGIFLYIKKKKDDDSEIEAHHMNLSDRLNS